MARPPKDARTEPIRDAILDAAAARFAARGYAGASLAAIAGDVGIRAQSIAHHFGNKDGLYEEVVRRFYERLAAHMLPALLGGAKDDAPATPSALADPEALFRRATEALHALPEADRNMIVTLTTEVLHAGRGAERIASALSPGLDLAVATLAPMADDDAPVREALALMSLAAVLSLEAPRMPEGLRTLIGTLFGDGERLPALAGALVRGLRA